MTSRNGAPSEDPGKRQAILDQAIRTFAELGFRGTDVQVIADRAGVGKGTVYRYFRSKEDLFWATTYEVLLRLERHVFAAMEGVEGACAKLRAAAAAYAEFFEANPQYLELFVQDRAEFRGSGPESHREHHEKMIGRMGEILQQGIEAGRAAPGRHAADHARAGQPAVRRRRARLPSEVGARGRDDRIRRRHFSAGDSRRSPRVESLTGSESIMNATLTEEHVDQSAPAGTSQSHRCRTPTSADGRTGARGRRQPWLPIAAAAVLAGGCGRCRGGARRRGGWYCTIEAPAGQERPARDGRRRSGERGGKATLGFAAGAGGKNGRRRARIETVPRRGRPPLRHSPPDRQPDGRRAVVRGQQHQRHRGRGARRSRQPRAEGRRAGADRPDRRQEQAGRGPGDARGAEGPAGARREHARTSIPRTSRRCGWPRPRPIWPPSNLKRAKDLFAKKVISTEAFDQTQTEYELAAQRYRQALFQIKQAYQVCKTAQIKLAILKKAVDDTTIRAPFDGWVAEKLVAVGEQISSGMQATKVVTLVRIDPLRLSLTVPQQDIGRIQPGQTVRFHVDSFPDRTFEATVRFIAPVVTNDTRSMVVEAVAPNPDGALRPGLFATAELELPKQATGGLRAAGGRAEDGRGGAGVRRPRRRGPRAGRRPGRSRPARRWKSAPGLTGKEILVARPELVHDGDAVRP